MATPKQKRRRKLTDTERLTRLGLDFARKWVACNMATSEKNTASVALLDAMKAAETTSLKVTGEHGDAKLTVVSGERLVTDWEKVKRVVGAKMWEKITVRVVSPELVDQAIKSGAIDQAVIAECSELVPSQPYIRTTVKGEL